MSNLSAPTGMTDAQYAVLRAYVRQLADAMLLADWELNVSRDGPEHDDAWADVAVSRVERHARIRVDATGGWWTTHNSQDERREHVVHELLHIHLDPIDKLMRRLAEHMPDDPLVKFLAEMHRDSVEVCVQTLSRVMAPLLPLPPEVP